MRNMWIITLVLVAACGGTMTMTGPNKDATFDVNGDGYSDFLVGAYSTGSQEAAHLYLGSATASATGWNGTSPDERIDLTSPDGLNADFGKTLASVGDVNGDGYADFLIGAAGAGTSAGAAHLYLGAAKPSAASWNERSSMERIDLASPDGAGDYFGWSVASAGDVNGDGYADFLVGAYRAGADAGAAHLYLGTATPSAASWNGAAPPGRIDLTDPDGAGAYFGWSVASAGDINNDGYADFLIGSLQASATAGAAHVYLGAATPSPNAWNGAAPAGRIDLASPDGILANFGNAVAGPGDVNGDGFADFLVGAEFGNSMLGAVHLYLGAETPGATAWNGASPARRIDLIGPGDASSFGQTIAGAGDVNRDGYLDFVIGADTLSSDAGVAYLYLGAAMPSATDWNPNAAPQRIGLATPDDANTAFGWWVQAVGDVNGDRYADFLVGAFGANATSGAAHLYLGAATPGATVWNGASPARRIDLANPDG